eukprot:10408336-Lingulodinium_polyedra.AAC.1
MANLAQFLAASTHDRKRRAAWAILAKSVCEALSYDARFSPLVDVAGVAAPLVADVHVVADLLAGA